MSTSDIGTGSTKDSSPSAFFRLVFLLSTPFYFLTALASLAILGTPEMAGLHIGLVTGIPFLSAYILTRQDGQRLSYSTFFHLHQDKLPWYCLAVLLGPLLYVLSYALTRFVYQQDIADPVVSPNLITIPGICVFFTLMATGEEVGWMGYAYEPLLKQRNGNALSAALFLGTIWALWHVPFFVFLFPEPKILQISCQVVVLIANRVLCVWLYENTHKSVLAVILYHAMDNIALMAAPDVKGTTPIVPCVVAVVAALIVMMMWDTSTMTQYQWKKNKAA